MRGVLLVVSLVIAAAIIFPLGTAQAQVSPGDGLLTINGGYITGTSAVTTETVDGNSIMFTYEKLSPVKPMSFGFSLGYSSGTSEATEGSSTLKTSTNSIPMFLGGKYWLGQSKFQFYLGAALGVYFSWLDTEIVETGESYDSVGTTGFGMAIPIGAAVSISEGVIINGNYTLNWLWSNEYFENDIVHAFNIGLGFKVGG